MAGPFRVLVVDDSAFMRKIISDFLAHDPALQVVGTARDGLDALEKLATLQPDVVTLDIEMPKLDGLGTLRRIMAENPRPVVMVSSLTQRGADATIQALSLGAIDVVPKPSGSISLDLHLVRDELVRKVKAAARVPVARLRMGLPGRSAAGRPDRLTGWAPRGAAPSAPPPTGRVRPGLSEPARVTPPSVWPARASAHPGKSAAFGLSGEGGGAPAPPGRLSRLVVVASSTGGPGALRRLMGPLPPGLRAGMLIVQHMPAGFTRSLAAHLNDESGYHVREATEGDRLGDGLALVAPGGRHMTLTLDGTIALNDAPPRHGVRPAADITLEAIPEPLVRRTLVIVLTGMGMDGARGAKYLKDRGAGVWAQDEASSVVYGMPRAVTELGVVDRVGSPEQIASWLIERMAATGASE